MSADGRGVVGHAGARLLADVAEATGLTAACGDALAEPGSADADRLRLLASLHATRSTRG